MLHECPQNAYTVVENFFFTNRVMYIKYIELAAVVVGITIAPVGTFTVSKKILVFVNLVVPNKVQT